MKGTLIFLDKKRFLKEHVLDDYDIIITGAGPVGCVIAERCATLLNWRVLLLDKRNHIAGNCYDTLHSGVLVHKYGPHYFRTNDKKIVDYLSQFTNWIEGDYYVKSSIKDTLYPFPINLLTINKLYDKKFNKEEAKEFIESQKEPIGTPTNSEEFVLSKVGRKLYETFYLGYTQKQWGKHPRTLDPSVCGRIPVRFNMDNRYVDHQYQLMPQKGYTNMFTNMINHRNIEILLETDYNDIKDQIRSYKAQVYCGPIDRFFDYKLGKLHWRSLRFEFVEYKEELKQPCVQINYPNDHAYTRSVEIKHVTKQSSPNTVISYEYPQESGDPFYPIPNKSNRALYKEYRKLATVESVQNKIYFCGRLATYDYINTDEAISQALETFEQIKRECKK